MIMEIFDFIAIDFETANESRDSACQIGITTVKHGQIQQVKSWLINPESYFNPFNTSIHGITPEMVKGQPTFKELWPTIAPYFGDEEIGNLIFAHNATFDINVLLRMLRRYQIPIPYILFGCSLAVSRRTWIGEPSYSLTSLCQKFKILPGCHDAGEDSRACAEIILLAAKAKDVDFTKEMFSEEDINEIEDKLQIFFGDFSEKGYLPSICQRSSKAKRVTNIVGDTSKNNPDSIFYQKNIVFTGALSSMKRSEAQQFIADIGGTNQAGVNKDTDYLVVGQQDFRVVGEDGMSSKQEKAIKMIEKGASLEILSEDEFLRSI